MKKHGGNGVVDIDKRNQTATKTLKKNASKESKNRFKKELQILKTIKSKDIKNIVKVLNIDFEEPSVKMQLYSGNLSSIFVQTQGDLNLTLSMLIPLITALRELTLLEEPIYHRDLKPANILVDSKKNLLCLADFGCSYVNAEESERQTKAFRAVGSKDFRAPEYDYGKVDVVNEKGDVFSIGKIIWSMLNGLEQDIFPYDLWYPDRYNLVNRMSNRSEALRANLIISRCVDIEPDNRPSYEELIKIMSSTLEDNNTSIDAELLLKAKAFEQARKAKKEKINVLTRNLLEVFFDDVKNCLSSLNNQLQDFELIDSLSKQFETRYSSRHSQIENKISTDVESYIHSNSFHNCYISMNFHSSNSNKNISCDSEVPYLSMFYKIKSTGVTRKISIYFSKGVLCSLVDKEELKPYSINEVNAFFKNLVSDYVGI